MSSAASPSHSHAASSSSPIARLSPSQCTYPHFRAAHLLHNTPCLFPAPFVQHWALFRRWFRATGELDWDALEASYGALEVECVECEREGADEEQEGQVRTFRELVALWRAGKGRRKYLKDWHLPLLVHRAAREGKGKGKERVEDELYRVPLPWVDDWMNEWEGSDDARGDDFRFVYAGGGDTFTPLHRDVYCSYSISTNLSGCKTWYLFPPQCTPFLRPLIAEAERRGRGVDCSSWSEGEQEIWKQRGMTVVEQATGETIFIPSGYYHSVHNRTHPTLSLNHNWCNAHNLPQIYYSLADEVARCREAIADVKELLVEAARRRGDGDGDEGWRSEWESAVEELVERSEGWSWTTFWRMTLYSLQALELPASVLIARFENSRWPLIPPEARPPTAFVLDQVRPLVKDFRARSEAEWRWLPGLEGFIKGVEKEVERLEGICIYDLRSRYLFMAVDSDIKLNTFAYEPVDAAEDPPTDNLDNGQTHAEDTAGLDDEELAWQRPAKRRRAWGLTIAAFVAGAVAGAALLSVGHWMLGGSEPVKSDTPEFTFLDETTTTTSAPSSSAHPPFDFLAVAPTRIHYRNEDSLNHREPLLPPACPIPVLYTTDESSADLVVFNSDSHSGLSEEELADRRITRPWQKTVVWGVESAPNRQVLETHLNKLRDGRRNETYDYEMCYRLNSTVPATYSYSYFNYANPPVPRSEKRSDKIAAAFITNCHPKNARTRILEELISLLPGKIDSFGACVNNANADDTLREMGHFDDVGQHNKWNTKITVINYYKFTVAFENSNDLDYTTEKYFQALERGSVPLVFGSPSFASRFLPAPNAAIDVSSYLPSNYTSLSTTASEEPEDLSSDAREGLKRLAERLEFLASDEGRDEYDAMLEWKRDGRWLSDEGDGDGENPLGKIVRMATSEWGQDCKLAGVYRGEEWARSGWVEPPSESERL
ncbi:hypothetical protein JCM1840_004366 [Sporobolomyces johnsonii]